MPFLPLTRKEMFAQGIEEPDFIFVTGDAYIDHPSFGCAIITRVLENFGYKCCIISQPDIKIKEEFKEFGKPRLGFLVSSGNIDSMVNHYTVAKKRRTKDYYTPNGEMGKRPDRAVIVYSRIIKELYPDTPIILGGIEASLRRLAHYDYWDNKVLKSILIDSKADIIVYGMGEKPIVEIADALNSGMDIKDIIYIRNTVYKTRSLDMVAYDFLKLPTYKEVVNNKEDYLNSFIMQYNNTDAFSGKALVEVYDKEYVVQNPPEFPLSRKELDAVYELPYMRKTHPLIEKKGHVPAIDEVKFSIVANRGCFGGCNFCALTMHQGRIIQSRSKDSIVNEALLITEMSDFKGYIHDVGGPTANFYNKACSKQEEHGTCVNKECIGFNPCERLEVSHKEYLEILKTLRGLDNVKKVFIRSGLRYDYIMYDKNKEFFEELVKHHISGQLKVAPEHIDDDVLVRMGKPSKRLYDSFVEEFKRLNEKYDKKQFLVPYLISSHPGSTISSAIKLALYLKENKYRPEQVQDFYPTPGTASTCMYYTEIDPFLKDKVYVAKDKHEKAMQRALLQYHLPQNYELVKEALIKAGRSDLIGDKSTCLIRYKKTSSKRYYHRKGK